MAVTNYYTVDGSLIAEETGSARLDNHLDALGSITAQTDSIQAVVAAGRYAAYGWTYWSNAAQQSARCSWCGSWGYRKSQASYNGLRHAEKYVRARNYSATAGRWNTVDPLWPQEPAYVYGLANSPTRIDPKGLLTFVNCPQWVRWWLSGICDRLRHLSSADLAKVNDCLRRNTSAMCPEVGTDMLKCMTRFCKQDGIVTCYPKDIPGSPDAAATTSLGRWGDCDPTDPYDHIALALYKKGTSVWMDVFPAIWVRDERRGHRRDPYIDLRNAALEFLHELGHACGIDHGYNANGQPRKDDDQCNDHFAGCLYWLLRRTHPA